MTLDWPGSALQAAVDEVDAQMSTWKPGSDLMRLNAAPTSQWIDVPAHLMTVLKLALDIGRASGGGFRHRHRRCSIGLGVRTCGGRIRAHTRRDGITAAACT